MIYNKFYVDKRPYICVGFSIGSICNYSCSYCFVKNEYYGSHSFVKYEPFFNFIKKLKKKYPDKKIDVTLIGGEPTIWGDFENFIRECKIQGISIRLISNGSRSLKWWDSILDMIDYLIISYHTEYANEEHITELMKLVVNKRIISQISFMMQPENFFENVELAKRISKNAKCFILLKFLREVLTSDLFDYTEDQLKYLVKNRAIGVKYLENDRYDVKIYSESDEGIVKHNNVNEVVFKKINRWKGWECTAGIDNFCIDYNQNLFVCNLTDQEDALIGNIEDDDYELPDKPFICKKEECTCLQDILECNKKRIIT